MTTPSASMRSVALVVVLLSSLGFGGRAGAVLAPPTPSRSAADQNAAPDPSSTTTSSTTTSSTTTSSTTTSTAPTPTAADQPIVRIAAISPRLPAATDQPQAIRFTVVVTAGASPLTGVELALERGTPLVTEKELANAVSSPPPTRDVNIPVVAIPAPIAARQSRTIVLNSTTSSQNADGSQGLCLACNPGVYPVDVSLVNSSTGSELARAHTFVPSFQATPAPVKVSWVWPLLDRPHRSASPTVFTDDDLFTSVSPNGRLDRALRVAELVAGKVRLTLLIDPEVIDALTVMSRGYDVRAADGVVHPGTGSAAAKDWLRRLAVVAHSHDVVRTAYADPDVDSLARASISWSPVLDADLRDSLRAALGVDPGTFLSWPAGEMLSSQGLDAVVSNGASAVLLSDKALPGALGDTATPDALAPLPSGSGNADALVLDSALQKTVGAVTNRLTGGAAYGTDSQFLLAQLAIRAAAEPTQSHYVVLAPNRYLDTDPIRTAKIMTAIAGAPFGEDRSVSAALADIQAVDHGSLVASAGGGLSAAILSTLTDTRSRLEALRECLLNNDASTLLGNFPAALSRGESSYWRTQQTQGQTFAERLRNSVAGLTSRVRITTPSDASYTLASSDAPLFITVENSLAVNVTVGLQVEPAPGERGLVARAVPIQIIPPGIHQIKVGTHVERTGRFKMLITLVSPTGKVLGDTSQIRVKSTAFGAVGLWITGVAFGVLLLTLVLRTVRRVRHRTPRPPREAFATPTGAMP